MSVAVRHTPGTLAERFWSLARSAGPSGSDDRTSEPKDVVRHVLRILDALSAGEVGAGLSQATVSFLTLLRQQEAKGDLSYASPEQARGESLDERSLVFSVGVLMFEELTGRHPFGAANNPRRFARIKKGELGSGVQYFPQVPGQLRNVLMRAMGPFPEERFASLRELRAALDAFVEDRPERAAQPKVPRPKNMPPSPAEIMLGVDESAATRVVRKPTPPGGTAAIAGTPGATPGGTPVPSAPQSRPVPSSQSGHTLEVDALPDPRRSRILERLTWLGLGAGGALAVTLIIVPSLRRKAANPEVVTAPAPARTVATRPVVAAPAVAPKAAAQPSHAPTVTPLPEPVRTIEPPPVPPVAEQPPATFDLEYAGADALTNARKCFLPVNRSISFGAGLLFSKDDAVARRVFLSPDEPLTPDERKCVHSALATASAGAAPDHNTVADYRFRIRPGDGSRDEFRYTLSK